MKMKYKELHERAKHTANQYLKYEAELISILQELDQTKALLTNSITSTFDSARGQIEVYDQFKELDEDFTADYLISKWDAVTKDDVKKMAKDIQLEVVYLLSGKEGTSNE